jgi:hypothetical protein
MHRPHTMFASVQIKKLLQRSLTFEGASFAYPINERNELERVACLLPSISTAAA